MNSSQSVVRGVLVGRFIPEKKIHGKKVAIFEVRCGSTGKIFRFVAFGSDKDDIFSCGGIDDEIYVVCRKPRGKARRYRSYLYFGFYAGEPTRRELINITYGSISNYERKLREDKKQKGGLVNLKHAMTELERLKKVEFPFKRINDMRVRRYGAERPSIDELWELVDLLERRYKFAYKELNNAIAIKNYYRSKLVEVLPEEEAEQDDERA